MGTNAGINLLPFKKLRLTTRLLFDVPLLIIVILLLIFGLLMQYSASWNYSLQVYDSATYILLRQITWVLVGLLFATLCAMADYHLFQRFAGVILGISVLSLIYVLLFTSGQTGYTRSIFGGSAQPSEFAKIALIIYLAFWLDSRQERLTTLIWGFIPVAVIICVVAGLILLQPDISATLTVVVLGVIMFFLISGSLRYILFLALAAAAFGSAGYFLFSKVSIRLNDYFNGLANPANASYHLQRSYEAILRGGVFGVGLGKSVAKLTGLPVAWTDSIFAVILEETGLIGGLFLIALYVGILWRGYVIFQKAPDMFGKLLAAGITSWIMIEAMINIGVMVNMLPFAGNALPLVSFGGSSMVLTLIGIGILMSIARVSEMDDIQKRRNEPDAFISLRRGDWGWGLSSARSRSGKKK